MRRQVVRRTVHGMVLQRAQCGVARCTQRTVCAMCGYGAAAVLKARYDAPACKGSVRSVVTHEIYAAREGRRARGAGTL